MSLRPYEPFASSTALVPSDPTNPSLPDQLSPYLGAAFRQYNDVYNLWDYMTRPQFSRDPNFNNFETTRNSKYWNDYRDSFIGAESQDEWNYIAGRIEQQNKDKQLLSSAPAAVSLGAGLFAGVLSPTMLIPALAPYRGIKGIAAAAALGAGAAAMQEVPLQANQETRTPIDGLENIAAGTLLGGIIGTGAQLLHVPEAVSGVFSDVRRQFQNDMARIRGGQAIQLPKDEHGLPTPITDEPIHVAVGETAPRLLTQIENADGVATTRSATQPRVVNTPQLAQEIRLPDLAQFNNELGVLDKKAATKYIGEQVKQAINENRPVTLNVEGKPVEITGVKRGVLSDAEGNTFKPVQLLQNAGENDNHLVIGNVAKDGGVLTQEGPLIQTPSTVPAAEVSEAVPQPAGAAVNPAVAGADAGGLKDGGRVLNTLAKLSPVAATIAQSEFPALRKMMAKLSNAGLRLEGNADFIPGQLGGTVEANVGTYDRFIGKMVTALDQHYADYFYDGAVQPKFPATRAMLASTFRFNGSKMTKEEFNREVARAMFEGDVHPISQVAASAKLLRSEIYDPILAEAKKVGLFSEQELLDPSYLARMYDLNKIGANTEEFISRLAKHFKQVLQDDLTSASNRLNAQRKMLDEYISDVEADQATRDARVKEFQDRLEALGESDEETQIKALQREQRVLRKQKFEKHSDDKARRDRLDEIKAQVKTLKEVTAPRSDEKRYIRRRLRNLNRSYLAVEEKRAKKLERIDRVEDDALNSLRTVLRTGSRMGKQLDKVSPRVLKKQVAIFTERVRGAEEALAKRYARLERASADGDMAKFRDVMLTEYDRIDQGTDRLEELRNRLDDAIEMNETAPVIREIIEDIATEASERINKLNLRRGARIAKLEEDVKKLTPENVRAHVEAAKGKQAEREARAYERFREMGLDDVDLSTGEGMVDAVARGRAEDAASKILKHANRITGLLTVGEERGHELERVLQIPSKELYDFLIMDVERITRNYIRQTAADIELMRAFGDVNAKTAFHDAETEYFNIKKQMAERGASAAEQLAAENRYRKYIRYLEASISRLRHTWGIPENPDGFAARAGKILLDLNTLRFMGSVAISSIPDLGNIIVKHGLSRVMSDLLIPMIRDFKQFRAASRELRRAGVGLDAIIHSRSMAYADILDQYMGHTVPERAIHTVTHKMGAIAAFDYWTSMMKQFDGVLNTARLMDSLDMVVNGTGSAKELKDATELLAQYGFNKDLAAQVWGEVERGGANKVNGFWMPNTEDWADDSRRVFNSALHQMSNDHVITPGLEIPLAANSSLAMRMVFQFKSFSLAAHTKLLMAGIQAKDLPLLQGAISSVALGMLSYYIWAMTIGGEAQKEMENAPFSRWMDEGIARSGLTAAFGEVQRVAERIPALAPYANFSGQRDTRRAGGDLTEALLGPSFDALTDAVNIAVGADDPTKSTVHQLRVLLPLQNVFYLRKLFDMMEESVKSHFPDKRQGTRKSKSSLELN